jgi:hypothetical protein
MSTTITAAFVQQWDTAIGSSPAIRIPLSEGKIIQARQMFRANESAMTGR